jgi:hypothetical protein
MKCFRACVSFVFPAVLVACGGKVTFSEDDGDSEGGGGEGGGGEGGGGEGGGVAVGNAQVRVAHLSPDAPAVDFCLLPAGAPAVGPVLQSVGVNAGLSYPNVTGYLPVAAGTYGVRLLAADALSCDDSLGIPDFTGITVSENTNYTVAATGMVSPAGNDAAFDLKAYVDNLDVPADKISVRFVHLSPDTPNVDVGLGSGPDFSPLFSNVSYGLVGQVAGGDYLQTDPLSAVTLSARATGSFSDALVLPGVSVPPGAVVTAFAIGNLDATPAALRALVCVDNAAAPSCTALP